MVDLATLNPQQRLAVETTDGPVLILAGAGTGKTRVITYRIAHILSKGISPAHVLGVTFTNKAAKEMQERVFQLIPKPRRARADSNERPPRPTLCTFHSLCVRILRRHIERLGYKPNFVIFDESEQLATLKKILSHISAKGEKTDPSQILALLSRLRNGGSRSKLLADDSAAAMADHIRARYESALRAANAVDFDDLILLVLRLFREHPSALEECRERYRYVMVDEYQDTNAAQFELVHSLTKNHRNLCVVGDDDQSIYGWRGAEVANLLDLEKHFPEVKVVKLEQNYRSTTTILTAANAVIRNNPRRRGKNLWSRNGQGTPIALHAFENDEEEGREIAELIEFNRMARRIPWGQQAILFRTNLQARPIETALRKAGIRYHLIGGQSFFDRREIRDLIAYLKLMVNPNDDVSLLRIVNTPARGLSDTTLERLLAISQERHCSVWAAMRHTDVQNQFLTRTRDAIQAFVRFVEHTRHPFLQHPDERTSIPLQPWAEGFLTECGYIDDLRKSEKEPENGENRVRNLRDLIANLDSGERASLPPDSRLSAFLEDITLDTEREEDKTEAGDAVTLITMHSCKGLEYPHVFIVGLEDGLLPHSRSKLEGTLDEERRLFYVAITRARETLTISHCGSRKKYGQALPCHPSPFLSELPTDLVEDGSKKAKTPVSVNTGRDLFASLKASLD